MLIGEVLLKAFYVLNSTKHKMLSFLFNDLIIFVIFYNILNYLWSLLISDKLGAKTALRYGYFKIG